MRFLFLCLISASVFAGDSYVKIPPDSGGGGGTWGSITGMLSSQTDLQIALNLKLNKSGGTMSGDINMGTKDLKNFGNLRYSNNNVMISDAGVGNAFNGTTRFKLVEGQLWTSGAAALDWELYKLIGNWTNQGNFTVTGNVAATDVIASGNAIAVDGIFSGDVSATNGTFSGNISAANYPPIITGNASTVAVYDQTGALYYSAYLSVDPNNGVMSYSNNAATVAGINFLSANISTGSNSNGFNGININYSAPTSTDINFLAFTNQASASAINFKASNIFNYADMSGSIAGHYFNNSGDAPNFTGSEVNNSGNISGPISLSRLVNTGNGVDTVGQQIQISGAHQTLTGLEINMNSATLPTTSQAVGLKIDGGALNVGSLLDSQLTQIASAMSLNSIGGQFKVSAGFPVNAGQYVFGNNLAPVMNFDDEMTADGSGLDLGFAAVGFVGDLSIADGTTVDAINMALAGAGNSSGGGDLNNLTMYYAAGLLPSGGTTVPLNTVGFKTSSIICGSSPNCWGLKVSDDTAHNYVGKLAIGTASKKVSNSSVGLELGGTTQAFLPSRLTTAERDALTAIEGMVIYNTTVQKHQGYDGTVWNNFY